MDQTHIGYTYWQQPDKQKMPELKYLQVKKKVATDSSGIVIPDVKIHKI